MFEDHPDWPRAVFPIPETRGSLGVLSVECIGLRGVRA